MTERKTRNSKEKETQTTTTSTEAKISHDGYNNEWVKVNGHLVREVTL